MPLHTDAPSVRAEPKDDFLSFDEWSAESTHEDPLTNLKAYSQYARVKYWERGELNPEVNDWLESEVYRAGVERGILPEDREEAKQVWDQPQVTSKQELQTILEYYDGERDQEAQRSLRHYMAALRLPDVRPDVLDKAREEANPYVTDEVLEKAKRKAVERGDAPFAVFKDTDGTTQVAVAPGTGPLDRKTIAQQALANPHLVGVDKLALVEDATRLVPGTEITKAEATRRISLQRAVEGGPTDIVERLQKAAVSYAENGGSLDQLVDFMREESFSYGDIATGEELAIAAKDYVLQASASMAEVDREDPAKSVAILSSGIPVIPTEVLLDKGLFDKALDGLDIDPSMKKRVRETRLDQLDSMAPSMKKLAAQADHNAFMEFFEKGKASGKRDGQIVEEWFADKSRYSKGATWRENLYLASVKAFATPTVGIMALFGDEASREALQGINAGIASNEQYGRMFGEDFGLLYDVSMVVPGLVADIGLAAAVTAATGGAGTPAAVSGSLSLRGAAKAATRAATTKAAATAATQAIAGKATANTAFKEFFKAAGRGIAGSVKNPKVFIPNMAVYGHRSAVESYVDLYSTMQAERNADGSPRYSEEDIRRTALSYGTTRGLITGAITSVFQHIGLGGAEQIANRTLNTLNNRQAREFYKKMIASGKTLELPSRAFASAAQLDTYKKFLTKLASESMRNSFKVAGAQILSEATEEGLDDLIGYYVERAHLGDDISVVDSLTQAGYSALIGGILGSAGAVSEVGISSRIDQLPATQHRAMQQEFFAQMAEDLEASGEAFMAENVRNMMAAARARDISVDRVAREFFSAADTTPYSNRLPGPSELPTPEPDVIRLGTDLEEYRPEEVAQVGAIDREQAMLRAERTAIESQLKERKKTKKSKEDEATDNADLKARRAEIDSRLTELQGRKEEILNNRARPPQPPATMEERKTRVALTIGRLRRLVVERNRLISKGPWETRSTRDNNRMSELQQEIAQALDELNELAPPLRRVDESDTPRLETRTYASGKKAGELKPLPGVPETKAEARLRQAWSKVPSYVREPLTQRVDEVRVLNSRLRVLRDEPVSNRRDEELKKVQKDRDEKLDRLISDMEKALARDPIGENPYQRLTIELDIGPRGTSTTSLGVDENGDFYVDVGYGKEVLSDGEVDTVLLEEAEAAYDARFPGIDYVGVPDSVVQRAKEAWVAEYMAEARATLEDTQVAVTTRDLPDDPRDIPPGRLDMVQRHPKLSDLQKRLYRDLMIHFQLADAAGLRSPLKGARDTYYQIVLNEPYFLDSTPAKRVRTIEGRVTEEGEELPAGELVVGAGYSPGTKPEDVLTVRSPELITAKKALEAKGYQNPTNLSVIDDLLNQGFLPPLPPAKRVDYRDTREWRELQNIATAYSDRMTEAREKTILVPKGEENKLYPEGYKTANAARMQARSRGFRDDEYVVEPVLWNPPKVHVQWFNESVALPAEIKQAKDWLKKIRDLERRGQHALTEELRGMEALKSDLTKRAKFIEGLLEVPTTRAAGTSDEIRTREEEGAYASARIESITAFLNRHAEEFDRAESVIARHAEGQRRSEAMALLERRDAAIRDREHFRFRKSIIYFADETLAAQKEKIETELAQLRSIRDADSDAAQKRVAALEERYAKVKQRVQDNELEFLSDYLPLIERREAARSEHRAASSLWKASVRKKLKETTIKKRKEAADAAARKVEEAEEAMARGYRAILDEATQQARFEEAERIAQEESLKAENRIQSNAASWGKIPAKWKGRREPLIVVMQALNEARVALANPSIDLAEKGRQTQREQRALAAIDAALEEAGVEGTQRAEVAQIPEILAARDRRLQAERAEAGDADVDYTPTIDALFKELRRQETERAAIEELEGNRPEVTPTERAVRNRLILGNVKAALIRDGKKERAAEAREQEIKFAREHTRAMREMVAKRHIMGVWGMSLNEIKNIADYSPFKKWVDQPGHTRDVTEVMKAVFAKEGFTREGEEVRVMALTPEAVLPDDVELVRDYVAGGITPSNEQLRNGELVDGRVPMTLHRDYAAALRAHIATEIIKKYTPVYAKGSVSSRETKEQIQKAWLVQQWKSRTNRFQYELDLAERHVRNAVARLQEARAARKAGLAADMPLKLRDASRKYGPFLNKTEAAVLKKRAEDQINEAIENLRQQVIEAKRFRDTIREKVANAAPKDVIETEEWFQAPAAFFNEPFVTKALPRIQPKVRVPMEYREDGTLAGVFTNDPEVTAEQINLGLPVAVPKDFPYKINPAIKVRRGQVEWAIHPKQGKVGEQDALMDVSRVDDDYKGIETTPAFLEMAQTLPGLNHITHLAHRFGRSALGTQGTQGVKSTKMLSKSGGRGQGNPVDLNQWIYDAQKILTGENHRNYPSNLRRLARLRDSAQDPKVTDQIEEAKSAILIGYTKLVKDFSLAVQVEDELVRRGHDLDSGRINMKKLMPEIHEIMRGILRRSERVSGRDKTKLREVRDRDTTRYQTRKNTELFLDALDEFHGGTGVDGRQLTRETKPGDYAARMFMELRGINAKGQQVGGNTRFFHKRTGETRIPPFATYADDVASKYYKAIVRRVASEDRAAYDFVQRTGTALPLDESRLATPDSLDNRPDGLPEDVGAEPISFDEPAGGVPLYMEIAAEAQSELAKLGAEADIEDNTADTKAKERERAKAEEGRDDFAETKDEERIFKDFASMYDHLRESDVFADPVESIPAEPVPEGEEDVDEAESDAVKLSVAQRSRLRDIVWKATGAVYPRPASAAADLPLVEAPRTRAEASLAALKGSKELRAALQRAIMQGPAAQDPIWIVPDFSKMSTRSLIQMALSEVPMKTVLDSLPPTEHEKIKNYFRKISPGTYDALGAQQGAEVLASNIEEAERMGLDRDNGKSHLDALRWIAENDPARGWIARILLNDPQVLNATVSVGVAKRTPWSGRYIPEGNVLLINLASRPGDSLAETLLHELLHASTVDRLVNPRSDADVEMVDRITKLREDFRDKIRKGDFRLPPGQEAQVAAALDSNEEFLTYALTSANFQKIMKRAEDLEGRSLWSRFVDWIYRMVTGKDRVLSKEADETGYRGPSEVLEALVDFVGKGHYQFGFDDMPPGPRATIVEPVTVTPTMGDPVEFLTDRLPKGEVSSDPSAPTAIDVDWETGKITLNPELLDRIVEDLPTEVAQSRLLAERDKAMALALGSRIGDTTEIARLMEEGLEPEDKGDIQSSPDSIAERLDMAEVMHDLIRKSYYDNPSFTTAYRLANLNELVEFLRAGGVDPVEEPNYSDPESEFDALIDALENGNTKRSYFALPTDADTPEAKGRLAELWKKLADAFRDLPHALRLMRDDRDAMLNRAAHSVETFGKNFRRLIKAAERKGNPVNLEDLRTITGSTAPVISAEASRQIESEYYAARKKAANLKDKAEKKEAMKKAEEDRTNAYRNARTAMNSRFRDQQREAAARLRGSGHNELVTLVEDFRAQIDAESAKLGDSKSLSNNVRIVIQDNLNVYLTRTYRFFNDEVWRNAMKDSTISVKEINGVEYNFDELRAEVVREFVRDIKERQIRQHGRVRMTDEEIEKKARAMLRKFIAKMASSHEKSLSSGDTFNALELSVRRLAKKGDLTPALRKLLGEVEGDTGAEVLENMVRTYAHLARWNANESFLQSAREQMLNAGIASETYSPGKVLALGKYFDGKGKELTSPTQKAFGKLWVDPALARQIQAEWGVDGMKAMRNTEETLGFVTKAMMRISGTTLALKTLGGPGFYPRNFISNHFFFMPFQGIPFVGPRATEAFAQSWATFFNKNDVEMQAEIRELVDLGILKDEIRARQIHEVYEGMVSSPERTLSSTLEGAVDGSLFKKLSASGVFKTLAEFNNFLDGSAKLMVYQYELGIMRKAAEAGPIPGITAKPGTKEFEDSLKRAAAAKTKRTMQGHSQVIPIVKSFSHTKAALLIAPFARFKSEVVRIMFTTPGLAYSEMKSGNPVLVRRGIQRMSGASATIALGSYFLSSAYQWLFNAIDDEDEAGELIPANGVQGDFIRAALPSWQRYHTIYARKKGDQMTVIDFTYIDPFSIVMDPVRRVYDTIGRDPDRAGREFVGYLFKDLVGSQIAAGAAYQILTNQTDRGEPIISEEDPVHEATYKFLKHYADQALEPGVLKKGMDVYRAMSRSGRAIEGDRQYNATRIVVGEAVGARPITYNMKDLMFRAFRNEQSDLREARRITGLLKSPQFLEEEKVMEVYNERVQSDLFFLTRARRHALVLEGMGVKRGEIVRAMNDAAFGKRAIEGIFNGVAEVWTPSKSDVEDYMKAANSRGAEGWEKRANALIKAREQLGTKLVLE